MKEWGNSVLRRQILEDVLGEKVEEYENFNKSKMNVSKRQHRKLIPLWKFLLHLLSRDKKSRYIEWSAERLLEFRIKDTASVAQLWGSMKNKTDMTYEKLGRAMRYYYGKSIIEKVCGKRYSYRFILSRRTKKYISQFVSVNGMKLEPIDTNCPTADYSTGHSPCIPDYSSSSSSDSSSMQDYSNSDSNSDSPSVTSEEVSEEEEVPSPSRTLNADYPVSKYKPIRPAVATTAADATQPRSVLPDSSYVPILQKPNLCIIKKGNRLTSVTKYEIKIKSEDTGSNCVSAFSVNQVQNRSNPTVDRNQLQIRNNPTVDRNQVQIRNNPTVDRNHVPKDNVTNQNQNQLYKETTINGKQFYIHTTVDGNQVSREFNNHITQFHNENTNPFRPLMREFENKDTQPCWPVKRDVENTDTHSERKRIKLNDEHECYDMENNDTNNESKIIKPDDEHEYYDMLRLPSISCEEEIATACKYIENDIIPENLIKSEEFNTDREVTRTPHANVIDRQQEFGLDQQMDPFMGYDYLRVTEYDRSGEKFDLSLYDLFEEYLF